MKRTLWLYLVVCSVFIGTLRAQDSLNLTLVSRFETPILFVQDLQAVPFGIAVMMTHTLYYYDTSYPSSPLMVFTLPEMRYIATYQSFLYTFREYTNGYGLGYPYHISGYDCDNPSVPDSIFTWNWPCYDEGGPELWDITYSAMKLKNNLLCFTKHWSQWWWIDFTNISSYNLANPAAPEHAGYLNIGFPRLFTVSGDTICYIDAHSLFSIRIGDSTVVSYYLYGPTIHYMYLHGNKLYLATSNGVGILDISDPEDMEDPRYVEGIGSVLEFQFQGSHLYYLTDDGTVGWFDVEDESEEIRGYYTFEEDGIDQLAVCEPLVYVADNRYVSVLMDPDSLQYYSEPESPSHPPHSPEIVSVYPNPFNSSTSIMIQLDHSAVTSIRIFDLMGREIETLQQPALLASGTYSYPWMGVSRNGAPLATGIYLLQVSAGETRSIKRLLLIK